MQRSTSHPARTAALALAMCMSSGSAQASGLQVEPVSVTMQEQSDIVWLANAGTEPIQAQVRVYRWTQDQNGDALDPSDALIASPPIVRIPAGGRQLVRLVSSVRTGCEDTFRLKIDELPGTTPAESGLRYVLHYSVPVFVTRGQCKEAAPKLAWRIVPGVKDTVLQVANTGLTHAQLAQASYVDASGRRTELTPGLLGYVLPGSQMSFTLAPPPATFAGGGTIELLVNGKRVVQSLPAG